MHAALSGPMATPASTPGGLGPADLADAYQLDTSQGYGQTVAVVDAYDDPTAAADLAVYRSQYGLPPCTVASGCFTKVNQSGTAGPLPAPSTGWSGEISLDLDMVSAVCPQCSILLVEANSSYLSDLGSAVDTAVRLGAKFVSNSYGGGEYSGVGANDVHYNHPGVAITASTGDSGYGVSYPASSPYVTAVGGTSLVRSATSRGWTETAWGGAGSGCSAFLARPAMQAGSSTGCANRAVADVSAVANPGTGVAVYSTYGGSGWGVYGGTSASSPIIASVYALAGTPGTQDYPNAYPYQNAGGLFDVTSGSNGSCGVSQLCSARSGWDGPTGLGSPETAAAFSSTGVVSGVPARFGVIARVTGPAVAGLAAPITATALLPTGDALAAVSWKAARSDCVIGSAAALSTTIACPATAAGTTSVTVSLTDTQAITKSATLAIAFTPAPASRAITVTVTAPGQTGTTQTACLAAATPMLATVTDAATGAPVYGVSLSLTRQVATGVVTTVSSGATASDGTAWLSVAVPATATLTARTVTAGAFTAGTSSPITITPVVCTVNAAAAQNVGAVYYGDPVTVTVSLTRDAGGVAVPLAGATAQINETVNGRVAVLAQQVTGRDGTASVTVRPTASGVLGVSVPATSGWRAASATVGTVAVLMPTSTLTATASTADVGYGDPVTLSGTLTRTAGAVTTALTGATVQLRSLPAAGGPALTLGSAVVGAGGTWSTVVRPRSAGELLAAYAGTPGQPSALADAGPISVGIWTTTVNLTAQYGQQTAGAANRLSGSVTRQYAGAPQPAASVPVSIMLRNALGTVTRLATVYTSASGTFAVTTGPTMTGTLLAQVIGVAGYTDAISAGVPVTVTTAVRASAAPVVLSGRPSTITVSVLAARATTVEIDELLGGTWTPRLTIAVASSGVGLASVTGLAVGQHTLRASVSGDALGGAGSSTPIVVTVR